MSSDKNRRNRDAGSGQFVDHGTAAANPGTTVSEDAEANRRGRMAQAFLNRVSAHGGAIVSAKDVTPEGMAQAEKEGRFYVDEHKVCFVWIPIKRTWR